MRLFGLLFLVCMLNACTAVPSAPRFHADDIRRYTVCRTDTPPVIDGIADTVWLITPWTTPFTDIEGSAQNRPAPRYETRAKLLWDDDCLYLFAQLEEPHLRASLTTRDTVIFYDNDFEVFLDPDGDNLSYAEIELNALNTVWDLFLTSAYRDNGKPITAWDLENMKSAVFLNGTLNTPADTDIGWTVEMAIPFKDLSLCRGTGKAPRPGEVWKANFSRVEWDDEIVDGTYRRIPDRPEHNWVWSPTGIVAIHHPERWGELHFSALKPEVCRPPVPETAFEARMFLHELYHAQGDFFEKHNRWTTDVSKLDLPALPETLSDVKIIFKRDAWEASVRFDNGRKRAVIRSGNGEFFTESFKP